MSKAEFYNLEFETHLLLSYIFSQIGDEALVRHQLFLSYYSNLQAILMLYEKYLKPQDWLA